VSAKRLLDTLQSSFADALRTPEGTVPPVALLWTDPDKQWAEFVPRLREIMPGLYLLGHYEPANRTGPAIWLKCVVDRTIPEATPADGITPVLYLPGVGRQTLRAGTECPHPIQPLIELQYRGRVWHQANGRDWTVEAFMMSKDGLGLDLAQDARTREAVLRVLPLLADVPIEQLAGRRLDADALDKLAVSDPIRDLLRWMSDPSGVRANLNDARWAAFRNVTRGELGVDPDNDLPTDVARRLAEGGGRWEEVWARFSEAPRLYPGIAGLLREPGRGQARIVFNVAKDPVANDAAEARLRNAIGELSDLSHSLACQRVSALEEEHGPRRQWVWAALDQSPLAVALEPMARLGRAAAVAIGGATLDDVSSDYAERGWSCDQAALTTMAATRGMSASDTTAVLAAVRALYLPWLESGARHFQQVATAETETLRDRVTQPVVDKHTCLLFADGLRFDVAKTLAGRLSSRGASIQFGRRLAALPTVTATAKPAVTPMHAAFSQGTDGTDFAPVMLNGAQSATATRVRQELVRLGFEVLEADECRVPSGNMGGWTEAGHLDELGHKLGVRLASHLDEEVDRLADRIEALLQCGWDRVKVVTDHGWLLVPGGLPKVDLPRSVVATKWARCAVVQGESTPRVPVWPWHWNPEVRIACPPGAGAFIAGTEYAHGGVSAQECIVPELLVIRAPAPARTKIADVQWRGLRCRVRVTGGDPSVLVDVRTRPRDPATSIVTAPKALAESEASLLVQDDRQEGAAASVVLIGSDGQVLDYAPTPVGEHI
jgi:hypothetical protein